MLEAKGGQQAHLHSDPVTLTVLAHNLEHDVTLTAPNVQDCVVRAERAHDCNQPVDAFGAALHEWCQHTVIGDDVLHTLSGIELALLELNSGLT